MGDLWPTTSSTLCRRHSIMSLDEKAWQDIRLRIVAAAKAAHRDPGSIRVLAVSKSFPIEAIQTAYAMGQREFGENYVQEARPKIAALSGVVGGTDAKPTSQSYTVFNDLSSQLDRQLSAMRGALFILPAINASLKAASLPPIVPSTEEIKAAAAPTAPSESDDEVEK